MKAVIATLLATSALVALAGSISTASARSPYGRQYVAPSVITPEERQRNAEAYERGEYYEHDSNALPWGSNAWREQRRREIGG